MNNPSRSVVDILRTLIANPRLEGLSDSELLRLYSQTGQGDAFASLVRRHGPMVLSLARRIVRDHHLAEDIFQATFLVLSRKAKAIRRRDTLSAWLHHVCFRLALRANKARRKLQKVETHAPASLGRDPLDDLSAREFLTILDEELNRLPEKYRLPLILCQLEGLSREEAARRLGWSAGAVKDRLEVGRDRLRHRLTRRGLAPAAALAGSLHFGRSALAVPPALLQATVRAVITGQAASAGAVALVNGAIKMMLIAKIKKVSLTVLLIGTIGWGAGWLAQAGGTAEQEQKPPAAAPPGQVGATLAQEKENEAETRTEFLRSLATATLRNRDRFEVFQCEFTIRAGIAKSIDDATAENLTDVALGKGVWVVNKEKVRFEFGPDKKPFPTQGGQERGGLAMVTSLLPTVKFLSNGPFQLRWSPVGANISIATRPDPGIDLTPFDMGLMGRDEAMSPGREIIKALDKGYFCVPEKGVNGRDKLDVVRFSKSPKEYEYRVSFDPAKGYLPVVMSSERKTDGPGGDLKAAITEAREISGRWFPTKSIVIFWKHNSQGPCLVRETVVTKLDVDGPIDEGAFFVQLPAGTILSDGFTNGVPGLHLDQATKADLPGLDRLSNRWLVHVWQMKTRNKEK